jgi:dolichol-phosphate mannosyltransferase
MAQAPNKTLSVLMPARNEAESLPVTLRKISDILDKAHVPFEIIVVNDHSKDGTVKIVKQISESDPRVRLVDNTYLPGYGYAVRRGLEIYKGDAVVIVMADLSDDP